MCSLGAANSNALSIGVREVLYAVSGRITMNLFAISAIFIDTQLVAD